LLENNTDVSFDSVSVFNNILVLPYQALNKQVVQGGPIWPDWDKPSAYRQFWGGKAIDVYPIPPQPSDCVEISEPMIWGGSIINHFGHFISEQACRLLEVRHQQPNLKVLMIGEMPPRKFLLEVLDWYGISEKDLFHLERPSKIKKLYASVQAEALPQKGPSEEYLNLLDRHVEKAGLPKLESKVLYVSRHSFEIKRGGHAGEKYLVSCLNKLGVSVIAPEKLRLRDQLAAYYGAETMVMAEGSSLHGRQLLGRSDQNIHVFVRREDMRVAEAHLKARVNKLSYEKVAKGQIYAIKKDGTELIHLGLSIYNIDTLFRFWEKLNIHLSKIWSQNEFELEQERDMKKWGDTIMKHGFVDYEKSISHIQEVTIKLGVNNISLRKHDAKPQQHNKSSMKDSALPIQHHSTRRINKIFERSGYMDYLEIGIYQGVTLQEVNAKNKVGVDPKFKFDPQAPNFNDIDLNEITSDVFFESLPLSQKFDLCFIDGLHEFEQTYRDFINCLLHSHEKTIFLIDDTVPIDIYSSIRNQKESKMARAKAKSEGQSWHGDVYKIIFAIHDFHPGLNYRTIINSGNPQTLVWKSKATPRQAFFDNFEKISRLSYFDLNQHKGLLHEGHEDDILEQCFSELAI